MGNPGTGVFHGSLAMHARTAPFWTAVAVIAAWSCLLCQPVYGAVEFAFGTDQDHYQVMVGSDVDVQVYLYETVTGGDSSVLVADEGLSQAQVTIQRSGAVPSDPAILVDYTSNTVEFDDLLLGPWESVFTDSELDLTQFVDIAAISGPTGVDLGGGVRRVWLLTLTIQAGSVYGETTTFSVLDNPSFDETLTFLGFDPLDPEIAPAEFTLTAVPEPASVIVWLLLGAPCAIACWRRRRRAG